MVVPRFNDAEGRGTRWYRWLPLLSALASICFAAALALGAIRMAQTQAQSAARANAQHELQRLREQLDRELQSVLAIPETVAAFVAAEGGIEDDVFAAVVSRLAENNGNIRNVALAPNSVITTVYPRQGNEAAIGLRYLEHPVQADAVRRAISSRRTVVAGPIKLVQGGRGIVSRTPVFLGKREGAPYWGIVALAVNADSIFSRVGFDANPNGVDIAARGIDASGAEGTAFAGKAAVFDRDPIQLQYPLPGGGSWQLAAAPAEGWHQNSGQIAGIAAIGIVLGLMVGLLTHRLVASHQRIRTLAVRDALTGLPNRRLFEDRMAQAMAAAQRHGRMGILIVLDLDHLKLINDRHGHRAGDDVLIRVASRVADQVRNIGSVARISGDEFAIILPEFPVAGDPQALVQRIQQTIAEPIALSEKVTVRVTASVGVTTFGVESIDVATLFERADKAMYEQKGSRPGAALKA